LCLLLEVRAMVPDGLHCQVLPGGWLKHVALAMLLMLQTTDHGMGGDDFKEYPGEEATRAFLTLLRPALQA
jgi:hypothetical protein